MAISGSIIPSFSAPKIGGGIGSRASNFIRPKISNLGDILETISTPIGGGRGANTPKISEGLIGFADTFGSPKTAKRIRKGVSSLRDILIESYDLAKILVATIKKTSDKLKGGLFGKGGKGGGGLLGGLLGGALVAGVLAVLKKVIIGAAVFMAGKWLLEMFGLLDQDRPPQPDKDNQVSLEEGSGRQLISQDKDGSSYWSKVQAGQNFGTPEYDSDGNLIGYSKNINVTVESVPDRLWNNVNDSNNPKGMQDGGIIEGKSHKEGGENINVEGGEAVIPKKTVKMLGVENILGLIQETNKKNISSSSISDLSEDETQRSINQGSAKVSTPLPSMGDLRSVLLKKFRNGVDGVHGKDGVDGKDGSSGINLIQSKITKVISSESPKKDPKTIVLPVDSAQIPIELPPQRSRQQIVNPSGSASNPPDIVFPPSTKSDSFGAFETRMIYNIVGG